MPRNAFGLAVAALLTPATALSIQGDEPYRYAPDQRSVRVAHPAVQAQFDQQPEWLDFTARRGDRWDARWDEATGQAIRIWGEGIAVDGDALQDDAGAIALAEAWLAEEAALLGVSLDDLQVAEVARRLGITAVGFTQTWRGLPVVDSRVSVRFKHDRLVVAQLESFPDIGALPGAVLTGKQAQDAARAGAGWPVSEVTDAELVVLPRPTTKSIDHRLAWQVDARRADGPGYRTVWIDAVDGSVLRWDEHYRFASGVVELQHDDRYPQNGLTTTPMWTGSISSDAGNATVAVDGSFSGPGSAPQSYSWTVDSPTIDIRSIESDIYTFTDELTSEGGTIVGAPGGNLGNQATRRVLAQTHAHQATHIARDLALQLNPGFGWAQQQAIVRVNMNEANCNAWFDEQSRINFMIQGGGCNNTARVADVVYHEYGHGFHGWNIVQGAGAFDGSLSEGLADYMAATITDDNGMGRGFFTGNAAPLRDVGPDRIWPQDIVADSVHTTGLIIGGTLWDLRVELEADQGQAGIDLADQIFLATASFAADIPDAYVEALLADDDDGNLANGTPNRCIIDEVYARHGLADGNGVGEAAFFAEHTPLTVGLPSNTDLAVQVQTGLSNPECADGSIASAVLSWDRGDGNLQDIDMTGAGDDWTAAIPGQPIGTFVRYRVDVYDTNGDVVASLPEGSITDPWYGAWVGDRDFLWVSDFESDDGGMSSDLLQGDPNTLGANDWMWEQPKGTGGDPEDAFSGNLAWGNDLTPEPNWNGLYQANIHSVLRSPLLEVDDVEGPILLQFRRWLQVEDGVYDQARVEVNGQVIWENLVGTGNSDDNHHLDTHWAFRSYDVTDLVTDEGLLEVSFEIISDGGLEFGGWTIDDLAVVVADGQVIPGDDDDATPGDDDDDDDAADDDDDDDATADDGNRAGGFTGEGAGCDCNAAGGAGSSLALLLLALGVRRRRG